MIEYRQGRRDPTAYRAVFRRAENNLIYADQIGIGVCLPSSMTGWGRTVDLLCVPTEAYLITSFKIQEWENHQFGIAVSFSNDVVGWQIHPQMTVEQMMERTIEHVYG